MEFWIFLIIIVAGVVSYQVISEKINLPKRIEFQKAEERRINALRKNQEAQNKFEEIINNNNELINLKKALEDLETESESHSKV